MTTGRSGSFQHLLENEREAMVRHDVKILLTTVMEGRKHRAGSTLHLCIEVPAISQAWGSLPANPRGTGIVHSLPDRQREQ